VALLACALCPRPAAADAAPPNPNDPRYAGNLCYIWSGAWQSNATARASFPIDRANFGASFLMTEAVDLGVAALVLWRLRVAARERRAILGIAALAPVLTLPAVWGFFPALGVCRWYGPLELAFFLPLGYAVMITRAVRVTRPRTRLGCIGLLVVSVPVLLVAGIGTAYVYGYGGPALQPHGMPWGAILAMAEVFAAAVEAALLVFFTRQACPWRRAILLSLAVNAASFLAGLAFNYFLPQLFF
jgi:hypothetical protein